jgi:hypothetical protein
VVGGRVLIRVRVTEIADHFGLHTALAALIVLSPIALLITRQLPEPHRAMKR